MRKESLYGCQKNLNFRLCFCFCDVFATFSSFEVGSIHFPSEFTDDVDDDDFDMTEDFFFIDFCFQEKKVLMHFVGFVFIQSVSRILINVVR